MTNRRWRGAAWLLSLGCAGVLWSQPAEETPAALSREAVKAYQAKDYARFLALEKRALALDQSDARLLYNVACGEALTGRPAEALGHLGELAARQLDLGAEKDEDFASIRGTPEWARYARQLAALRKPLVHSVSAFALPDPTLLPAGLAVDPRTGATYIGSTRRRKILRRAKDGTLSDFTREGQDGLLAVASLLIDSGRGVLFASTAPAPGLSLQKDASAGVFVFDLATGKLVRKAQLAPDGKTHFLNALAADHAGNVYVSDSAEPGIYRLAPTSQTLEKVIPDGLFEATQGLAFRDDDETLFVADWTDGLWAYDLKTRTRRKLAAPQGAWLAGMDGLSTVPAGFVTVQIGVRPERVLLLRLDPVASRIASVDVLEMGHPDYEGPIQGVVDGGSFLYVANSQLDLVDGKTGAFAAQKARPSVVLSLPVPP